MKKINLSNRSINLLKTDNRQWFKSYVLWERDNEFQPYFAIGACFASCMEARAKTWSYDYEIHTGIMEQEFADAGASEEELAKASITVLDCIANAQTLQLDRPIEAEYEVIVPLNDRYDLKCKFDALYSDHILDHKTVSSFTNPADAEAKYGQQMRLYQYAYYKQTGRKLPAYIQEIKKELPSIPANLKKADLLALIPTEDHDACTTVQACKEYLRVRPLQEWVGNRIEFARDDTLIEECETLLARAIKKADYLQSLTIDDVL